MKDQIIHGIKIGISFAIITIFLFLIGFLNTIADILGRIFKIEAAAGSGLTTQMINMFIFLALLGLWAGAAAAKKRDPDSLGFALVGSGAAGISMAIPVALTAYLFGTLLANGAPLTRYLAAMLPPTINLFLLNRSPLDGALSHFLLMLIFVLAGGVLARGFGRANWRRSLALSLRKNWDAFLGQPTMSGILRSPVTRYVVYGALILLVFLLPLRVGQYWNYTIGTVGIYVLLGLGLNIVVGMAGLLNLGYVAFFAIGAYAVALLTAPQPHAIQMSFWLALPIAIFAAAMVGILLGIPILRTRGDYLAIVTLGFGEIIRTLSRSDVLTSFTGGPRGVPDIGPPTFFGRQFNDISYVYLTIVSILIVIFIIVRLRDSRVGRSWIAMREDETVAQAMGINLVRNKLLAFAIGAAIAGLGGAIFAARNRFTGPEDHNLMVSINVLAVVIVGGMGSIPGVFAGAFVLKGLPEVLRQLENFRILAFGALLVVMMIMRPEGIIPTARRRLELKFSRQDEDVIEADIGEPKPEANEEDMA